VKIFCLRGGVCISLFSRPLDPKGSRAQVNFSIKQKRRH